MLRLFWIVLIPALLPAQSSCPAGPVELLRQLRAEIENGALIPASDTSRRLHTAVQDCLNRSLAHDSGDRVKELLNWLQSDIESFWVNQSPFVLKAAETTQTLGWYQPILLYTLDRLIALDGGRFYSELDGRTIRMAAAAARNLPAFSDRTTIPGSMDHQEVAYFYFFDEPVTLPPPTDSLDGKPAWRALAKTVIREPVPPGQEPRYAEDEHWMALASPKLLILSNRREMLTQILQRMARPSARQALPPSLPEWSHVDLSSPFWGVRVYSENARPKEDQRGFRSAQLPNPDGRAQGVVLLYDPEPKRIEIRYLSENRIDQARPSSVAREFLIEENQPGVSRLVGDLGKRGAFPAHLAMEMLGFGVYR